MRYFIGCMPRGEIAEYYKMTATDFASRFGVTNVSDIVPAHITIKSPFERNNLDDIENIITQHAHHAPIDMKVSGWDSFGNRTIFLDVPDQNTEVKKYIVDLVMKLNKAGLGATPQERLAHLHISVARFLNPKQFQDIATYLKTIPAPVFDIKFDNITIFVKENREDRAWKVLKTIPLLG